MDPFFPEFFAWRIVVFENLTAWFGPNFPISRRIDLFWGLSWDTQPFWILFSSVMPLILFRHLSLTFYWAAHQPRVCLKWQRSPYLHPDSDLWFRHTGGCHKSHDGSAHFPFRKSLHGLLPFNPEGLCSSWTAILIRLPSVSLGRRFQSRRGWMCSLTRMRSASAIASVSRGFPVSETTRVSSWTLSICLPLKAFSHYSFRADVSSSTTLDQCSRLKSFIPSSEIARPYRLINMLSYHRPQVLIARR